MPRKKENTENIESEERFTAISIGMRIKYFRQMKGMTQAELASALNLPVQNISNMESGFRMPKFDKVCDISKTLEINPLWIYNFSPFEEESVQTMNCSLFEFASGMKENEDGTICVTLPKQFRGLCKFYNDYHQRKAQIDAESDEEVKNSMTDYNETKKKYWLSCWPTNDSYYMAHLTHSEKVNHELAQRIADAKFINYCQERGIEIFP